jgi:hypothetical protein
MKQLMPRYLFVVVALLAFVNAKAEYTIFQPTWQNPGWIISHEITKDAFRSIYHQPITKKFIIAWQPSHQDDTGYNSWHEYLVCNDIATRAMQLLPEYKNVKAWDVADGLTGSNNYFPQPTNTKAFDQELVMANSAKAQLFIAVHVDGGASSGILAECMQKDNNSCEVAGIFLNILTRATRLPSRGVHEIRLYSLEPERNKAPLRILLELGDNQSDRAYLESAKGRSELAQALAEAVRVVMPIPRHNS